ncbi:MAG: transporter substrate-binding domain-containing protein [Ruminococcus sp.]|nr:transporter substrate-binding domain-containing protein [Ruminococcus sp.]
MSILTPAAAADDGGNKVVRIGWFDSSFCYYDSFGRRCGVDYEYHQKISAYTGWDFEYVEDSWPNLMQMLKDGKIDLLCDVSYKPEREKDMYFSDLPMGTEAYYIYIGKDNREIKADDLSSFGGKRIGVNKGSIQENFLYEWKEKNGISFEILPLTCGEDESMEMIDRNEIDGLASIFTFDYNKDVLPVTRIGSSDYYYAVSRSRHDLLEELNMAMAEIQEDDPYFNDKVSKEGVIYSKSSVLLSPQQEDWLDKHGDIRIGYRSDYMPFCSNDESGGLTGALKDYIAHAKDILNSPNLSFSAVPYDTTEKALNALTAGEIDCVFPVYLSTYDADIRGVRLTDHIMETEMNAIMRISDHWELSAGSGMIFAVNSDMVNVDTFIMDIYPEAERKHFPGLQACCDAVSKGKADCVLVSSYRMPSEEEMLNKSKLFAVPTGEALPLSFAVRKADRELYAVMNKIAMSAKSSRIDAALASYMYDEQEITLMQMLRSNWLIVVAVLTVLFLLILFLLGQKLRAERIANKQRHLLEEAARVAELQQTVSSLLDNMPGMYLTKDAKTGEYLACNQAFAEYARKKEPSEVIGLTAQELFGDKKVCRHAEDDRMVLTMDEPLIYYDSMEDALGNMINVKITKQKYTDANGRLCVLGVFQDASNTLRISRDMASTKESYEKARSNGIIFTHIAQALAQGFTDLFYIDLNTEGFIEYRSDDKDGSLSEVRRGWHFFELFMDAAEEYLYHEDREEVVKAMDRKTLTAALEKNNVFMMTCRVMKKQQPVYMDLKVTRMHDDDRFIILSMTDVDEQIKQRQAANRMKEEQSAYSKISALAGDFLCIYIVSPESGRYREYSSAAGFDAIAVPTEGEDFFTDFRENSIKVVYPEDKNRVFTALTMENAIEEVRNNGIFTLSYRLVMNDEPRYVQLKAALVEEQDSCRLIVGVNDIDAQVRQEEEYSRRLAQARIEANIDALTGVKNRNAYRVYEDRLNAQIEMNRAPEFAIIILDLNDLKKVNDSEGHKAGDQFIRDACRIICTTFKRSPVFRVGGDEFAVISQGEDYSRIEELAEMMNAHNEEAVKNGGIVIAMGVSCYNDDTKVAQVYERADQRMYEDKSRLKEKKKLRG